MCLSLRTPGSQETPPNMNKYQMIKLIVVFVQIEFYLPAMLLGGWPDCCVRECSPAMPSG